MAYAKHTHLGEIARFNEFARELGEPSAIPALFEVADRAGPHYGFPISKTVLDGGRDEPGEIGTIPIAGREMLIVVWRFSLPDGQHPHVAIACDLAEIAVLPDVEVPDQWAQDAWQAAHEWWDSLR
jgi:hypothetical protein